MSKRLQITLSDDGYKRLMEISEAMHYKNKSGLIECGILELYEKLVRNNFIEKK